MLLVRPDAQYDQMLLKALDRITQRPVFCFAFCPILGWIIACRMGRCAIGEMLDQRRAKVLTRALGSPFRYCIDREEIVAVDPHSGNSVSVSARREGRLLAASYPLKGRDSPLIVHNVQYDRCAIHGRKSKGVMKIAFRRSTVPYPCRGDAAIAFVGRSHGPTDCLAILSSKVSRN